MLGLLRFALVLALCALPLAAMAVDPPVTRMDVVQATNGECRYRWILEPGETRLVYCDLSAVSLPRFSAVVESGSYSVPGYVSDTFDTPLAGAIAVLHNPTSLRQRGASKIKPVVAVSPSA
jgi:hypothetical protein